MLLYVLVEPAHIGVFPTDNTDETFDNLIEFSPHVAKRLVVTEGGEREFLQFCKKFKELRSHGNWFLAVPSVLKHIAELPGATSSDGLREIADYLANLVKMMKAA
jgi:hypothetical protein